MEQSSILAWTLVSECPIPPEIGEILVTGEVAIAAYKTFRDSAVFTNKRLIVRDAQGIRGKKVEVYSLPYSSVLMWSSENAGRLLDFNSELELWTKAGHIKVNLNKGLDIRRLDRLLSEAILGSDEVASMLTVPPFRPTAAGEGAVATAVAVGEASEAVRVSEASGDARTQPAAAWFPDPHGRHQLRYWDGQNWTRHVSDDGVQSTD